MKAKKIIILGILTPIGGSLTELQSKGQISRLLNYYFKVYAGRFDRIYYFSYFNERLEDFTDDLSLLKKIIVIPKKSRLPNHLYAVLLPLMRRKYFKRCNVFRVFQAPGALPLTILRFLALQPCMVTYGYNYSQFAQISGAGPLKVMMIRLVERLALRRAIKIVVTNEQMLPLIGKRNKLKVVKIPNGVDTSQFCPAARNSAKPLIATELLFIGRFEVQKNLVRLLEAVAIVKKKHPVNLTLVGEGSQEIELRESAQRLDINVRFKGVIDHDKLPRLLNSADIFVLPSLSEGHPKALIEAMSCGLPVTVSNSDGNTALVKDGVSGLLIDQNDAGDIAAKIISLIDDKELARRIGLAARDFVVTNYDIKKLIDKEIAQLESMMVY